MAVDLREPFHDPVKVDDLSVFKPRVLEPLASETKTRCDMVPALLTSPMPLGRLKKPGSRPGSLMTRMELATGEASPAAALIKFAHQVSGCNYDPALLESSIQRLRSLSRPGTTSSSTMSLRQGASQANVSVTTTASFVGSSASSPSKPRKRGGGDASARAGTHHAHPELSLPSSCGRQHLGGRRPTRSLRPQARWSVTSPRWEVCARASMSPSVRAYGSPPIGIDCQRRFPKGHRQAHLGVSGYIATDAAAVPDAFSPEHRQSRDSARLASARSTVDPASGVAVDMNGESEVESSAASLKLPWAENELRIVFNKFCDAEDQEVRTENLMGVLRYLGVRPEESDVSAIASEQTHYACLDWTEFMEFLKRYRAFEMKKMKELFESADEDKSDELDIQELHQLLIRSGYAPTVDTSREALQIIDEDGSGTVNFSEFEKLLEHLRVTQGFLKSEAEELNRLFRRSAGDNTWMHPDAVWRISSYLGYAASREEVSNVVWEIDRDKSCMISYDELLKIIRGIRDAEKQRSEAAFTRRSHRFRGRTAQLFVEAKSRTAPFAEETIVKRDTYFYCKAMSTPNAVLARPRRGSAAPPRRIPIEDVQTVLADLGYWASETLVEEMLSTLSKDFENPQYVTREEIVMVLRQFRRVEGFTHAETQDLFDIFKKEQRQNTLGEAEGSLDALELGRVLRWLGIARSLTEVQRLIDEIDFDGSGKVEFHEFTKLMRQIWQAEAQERRNVFRKFDYKGTAVISQSQLNEVMTTILGSEPDEYLLRTARMASTSADEEITFFKFESIYAAYRAELVEMVRQNAGYIPSEVDELKQVFIDFDRDGTGTVGGAQLRRLIAETVPEATWTKNGQQEMQRLLREVHPEDPRCLDFSQFLWLTRRCSDQRDEEDIKRELEVLKECQFSSEEVEGFRALFSSKVSWKGELSLEAFIELIARIQPITSKEEEELSTLICGLSMDRRAAVRFPQFLQLIHHLTKDNRLGLNDAAERFLRRQQELRKRIYS